MVTYLKISDLLVADYSNAVSGGGVARGGVVAAIIIILITSIVAAVVAFVVWKRYSFLHNFP